MSNPEVKLVGTQKFQVYTMKPVNKQFGPWKTHVNVFGNIFAGDELRTLLPLITHNNLGTLDYNIPIWLDQTKQTLYFFSMIENNPDPNDNLREWRRTAVFLRESLDMAQLPATDIQLLWVEITGRLFSIIRHDGYVHFIADHGPRMDFTMYHSFCMHVASQMPQFDLQYFQQHYQAFVQLNAQFALNAGNSPVDVQAWVNSKFGVDQVDIAVEFQRIQEFMAQFGAIPGGTVDQKLATMAWRLQSDMESVNLLYRPITSVFDLDGPPYHEIAGAVEAAEAGGPIDFSEEFRRILRGENSQYEFIPLLTGAWFLSEPARRPNAFIIGLMVLDLMHMDYNNPDGIFKLKRCMIHPCNALVNNQPGPFEFSTIECPDEHRYFNKTQVNRCGGRHPMCGQNSAPLVGPPSVFVGLKEADILTRWVALCIGFANMPEGVARVTVETAIRNIFLWRITHCDLLDAAVVAQYFVA